MIRVKKILPILFFLLNISCQNRQEETLLHPIPILKVNEGELQEIDLSKYYIGNNLSISLVNSVNGIRFNAPKLYIDSRQMDAGLFPISMNVNGQLIQIYIQCNSREKHTFSYESSSAKSVVVMGPFNDWSRTSLSLHKNGNIFSRAVFLNPKKHEYKFVVDGVEKIDPNNPVFISNNIGGFNSILDLSGAKESEPGILIKNTQKGSWLYYDYIPPEDGAMPVEWIITLDNTKLHPDIIDFLPQGGLRINIANMRNGLLRIFGMDTKKRIFLENQTILRKGKPLSTEIDDWHFSVIYNVMVDRFFDGEEKNNHPIKDPKLHSLANFFGGDLQGINQKIEEGYFDDLNVSALWISPLQTQPDSSWIEWIEPHRSFSGYHGYWPIKAREIDARYGTQEDLKRLISLSHNSQQKVLLDFVSNHVHQDHQYYQEHPDWFGDVDLPNGEKNIRNWSKETQLTTWFDEFIPSFDFSSSPEAIDQIVSDAIWWMDEYNLDGFRQDAVKHVPHIFWRTLAQNIQKAFPEKSFYQIGETFGSDALIGSYVNPSELDAQFNFSIYFNVRSLFSSDNTNFSDLKNIILENQKSFGPIHLMGNITSSHDQFRFAGYADGQINMSDNGIARSFENPVGEIQQLSTYKKLANFHAFNLSQPGIPIIYYGEEIALMGEGDPGNRRMMNFDLNNYQIELKKIFSDLNALRQKYPSLALGDQVIIKNEGPILVILKKYFDETILIGINNSPDSKQVNIEHPIKMNSIKLLFGSGNYVINNKKISLTIPPYSSVFYLGDRVR